MSHFRILTTSIAYKLEQVIIALLSNRTSMTTQQNLEKIGFFIDCDGGLSAAFHSKRPTVIKPDLIKDFPPNSDIFLFYNSNDPEITTRMQKLAEDNDNVHVYPNINQNIKNGADMNLSFILGRVSDHYGTYVIIARHDKAYQEVQERLKTTHLYLKNRVELRRFHNPKELAQYIRTLNRSQTNNQDEGASVSTFQSARSSSITIKFTSEDLFHPCPLETWQDSSRLYRFEKLLHHLDEQHRGIRYHYCPTCEDMIQQNNWTDDWCDKYNAHIQKKHLDNKAGFCLSIPKIK